MQFVRACLDMKARDPRLCIRMHEICHRNTRTALLKATGDDWRQRRARWRAGEQGCRGAGEQGSFS